MNVLLDDYALQLAREGCTTCVALWLVLDSIKLQYLVNCCCYLWSSYCTVFGE